MDANGGSCSRSAAGAAYSDAAACASLNAAYQAASAGDLVQVTAGSYPSQSISPKASAAAPAVVIEAAAGATVVIKELDITASWLTLRNMTVQPVAGRGGNDKIIDINRGSRQLTLDNVDLDGRINGVRQVRDGLGISGDTDYVTVKNSDLCCIQDQKLIQIQTYGTSVQNPHLTLARNTIHDDWQTDSSKHLECLWLEGISDFLLDGNHFYDCALNAILANADEGGTYANWTITNNVFEAADTGVGGIPPDIDGCAATHTKSNWLIAYNYIARGFALTTTTCGGNLSWLTMRGNIGAAGDTSCGSGATWEYNIWAQRKCSSSDTQNSNITAASNYQNAKADEATGKATTTPPPTHPKSTKATPPSGPQPTPTAPPAPTTAAPTPALRTTLMPASAFRSGIAPERKAGCARRREQPVPSPTPVVKRARHPHLRRDRLVKCVATVACLLAPLGIASASAGVDLTSAGVAALTPRTSGSIRAAANACAREHRPHTGTQRPARHSTRPTRRRLPETS